MPRPRSQYPSLRRHRASGQGIVTLSGTDVYLGKWPEEQPEPPPEVQEAYDRKIHEWVQRGRTLPRQNPGLRTSGDDGQVSINEVMVGYVHHIESYYRHPDGRPTSEVGNIKLALRRLKNLYGSTPIATFDPLALEAIREKMIGEGLCRNRINKDTARIKRFFRWAASKKLCSPGVWQSLSTVEGLRAGRSGAKETEPVRPVSWDVVANVLPHLAPQLAAMLELQWHTGMRPGEVLVMRTCDLDTSGEVWQYVPGSDAGPYGKHKTAWRGQKRIILIGPRGQKVLRPWLRLNLQEYLFQPREAVAAFREEQRKKRKTPVQPSQKNRKKPRPKKRPGQRYSNQSYCQAIYKACDRAFPPPAPLAQGEKETKKDWLARLTPEQKEELNRWQAGNRFHANQLRHAKATQIRKEAGLDTARAVLGHRTPAITEMYAEIDTAKAAEIMARIG